MTRPTDTDTDTVTAAPLLTPGAPGYDAARSAFSLTADLRPAAIAVVRTIEEVQAALGQARALGLTVTAMTSGHIASALPPLGDTLLIRHELPESGGVEVYPEARVARIHAGATWGDVVDAVTPHGLTAMHGSSRTVSAVGYLLAGGLSFYGREHGLAANHVRGFEAVTMDGVARRVGAVENPELFWALRGGGGSFAVVHAIELDLLPYAEVHAGALTFAIEDARPVLRAWRDWTRTAPRSVTSSFRVVSMPSLPQVPEVMRGRRSVSIDAVALDPLDGAEFEAALRAAATPTAGAIGPMPAAAVSRLHGDPEAPIPSMGDGGVLLGPLDDDALDAYLAFAGEDSPLLVRELRQLGGALASAPKGAGVRGSLEGEFVTLAGGLAGVPAPAHELRAAVDAYLDALRPWATGTSFMAFAVHKGGEIDDCVPPDALARLARVRRAVDPDRMLVTAHRVP